MSAVRRVPILMYHSIASAAPQAMRRFTVTPATFKEQLRFLKANGYVGLTIGEFVRTARIGGKELPAKPIVLTFDDGFADFMTEAMPTLSEFAFTATLYVVAGQIGGTSAWLPGESGRLPLLNKSQLRELQSGGVEIGAHGLTHPALDGLDADALVREVKGSKDLLEQVLGQRVDTFAYPFGFRNSRVRRTVEDAGYSSACAVRYETSSTADDRFDLARHIVPGGVSQSDFALIANGSPRVSGLLVDRIRSRAAGKARRVFAPIKRMFGS